METLHFITSHGVCGHTEKWSAEEFDFDADGWLAEFGPCIGSADSAPLPNGGFIDLSQFACVVKKRTDT